MDYVAGRGLRISFPVSSHDILKSLRTCRVRDVNICGAITNLWMPKPKSDTTTKKTIKSNDVIWRMAIINTHTNLMLPIRIYNDLIGIQLMEQLLSLDQSTNTTHLPMWELTSMTAKLQCKQKKRSEYKLQRKQLLHKKATHVAIELLMDEHKILLLWVVSRTLSNLKCSKRIQVIQMCNGQRLLKRWKWSIQCDAELFQLLGQNNSIPSQADGSRDILAANLCTLWTTEIYLVFSIYPLQYYKFVERIGVCLLFNRIAIFNKIVSLFLPYNFNSILIWSPTVVGVHCIWQFVCFNSTFSVLLALKF